MKRRRWAWLWAAVSCVVLCSATLASAQEKKRVVVLPFDGQGATAVRGHVLKALQARSEVQLVPPRAAERSRQQLGVSWGSHEAYQGVGAELGVAAFVEGHVERAGKRWRAVISVRDASSGAVRHEEPWTRPKPPQLKDVRKNFWTIMGPHILASSAPEEPEEEAPPVPVAEPEPEAPPPTAAWASEDPEPEPEALRAPSETSGAHPALVIWAGPRLMWRTLSYEDASTLLSSYENAPGSPAVNAALGLSWFPGAHVRGDWVSNIGLEAEFDYSMGLKSRENGQDLKTTAYEFSAGALFRLPLDTFEPRFRVGYVKHVFEVDVPAGVPLPGVNYGALRFGLGTAIHLAEWLGLDVNAAYLHLLDTGEIGAAPYDSGLGARAFEFGGAVFTRFKEVYGLRLGVDFRRYAFDFSGAGSGLPTGAGSDHYLRTTLAFVYNLPGVAQ